MKIAVSITCLILVCALTFPALQGMIDIWRISLGLEPLQAWSVERATSSAICLSLAMFPAMFGCEAWVTRK